MSTTKEPRLVAPAFCPKCRRRAHVRPPAMLKNANIKTVNPISVSGPCPYGCKDAVVVAKYLPAECTDGD